MGCIDVRSPCIAFLLTTGSWTGAASQQQVIPDPVTCATCVIEIGAPRLVLGRDLADGGFPTPPRSVVQDSHGRYWVTVEAGWTELPYVFGTDGRLIAQVGREGDGPGEFRRPSAVAVLNREAVVVTDDQAGRASIFDADLRFVRSWRIPPYAQAVVGLPDGTTIVAGSIQDPERVGRPLHRFDAAGSYAGPFGGEGRGLPGRPSFRILAASRQGVWSATRLGTYEIERFDMNGALVNGFARTPDWFVSRENEADRRLRPPQPGIPSVHEDEQDRLWVLARVPDARWKEAYRVRYPDAGNEREFAARDEGDYARLYDSWVEVINPSTARVIARAHFDDAIHGFVGEGQVAVLGKRGFDDLVTIEIRPIRLRQL